MDKYKKLWLGIASVGMAVLMFLALLVVQQLAKKEPVYEEVLCAKQNIADGLVVTEENVSQYIEVQKIPQEYVPEVCVKSQDELYGKAFEGEVTKGSILTEVMCAPYLKDYEKYQCLTWISVPVKELYEGVAGSIRTGDYIDIYTLWKEGDVVTSKLLAEHVLVKETYTVQGVSIKEGDDGLSQLIVIPIEKEQVSIFYEMLAKGNIRIAKYEET